jgi:organic hydroperoxide reductase OsmC/OhrA
LGPAQSGGERLLRVEAPASAGDCIAWLKTAVAERQVYDLIFLDPPTFSNSKRMDDILDVQRDHRALIDRCMALLAPGGKLVFSNNAQKFKLDAEVGERYKVTDISRATLPKDFERNRASISVSNWRGNHDQEGFRPPGRAVSRKAPARSPPRPAVLKNAPYGFKARFEDGPGTNPEGLIGAAHAACFSMALSAGSARRASRQDSIQKRSRGGGWEKIGDGFAITHSDLVVRGEGAEHRRTRPSWKSPSRPSPAARYPRVLIREDFAVREAGLSRAGQATRSFVLVTRADGGGGFGVVGYMYRQIHPRTSA